MKTATLHPVVAYAAITAANHADRCARSVRESARPHIFVEDYFTAVRVEAAIGLLIRRYSTHGNL